MSGPETAVDLDLRLVRYFVTVAEHQHFGRAAEALLLAQPSLSRQIKRLEQQLGVRLLDRSAQGTQLTDAGQEFLGYARTLLSTAVSAATAARAAVRPLHITIGHTAGLIVTPAVQELRRRQPEAEVHTRHLDWDEPRTALLEHRVDAAVARLPLPADELRVTVLYTEPRLLAMPHGHRLATAESLTLDDMADEVLSRFPDDAWNAFWRVDPRPDGRPAPDGPLVRGHEDNLERVAGGQALTLLPVGALPRLRPDLVAVPVRDVEPCQVVLATRAGDRNRLVAAFSRCASAHLTGSADVVPDATPATPPSYETA